MTHNSAKGNRIFESSVCTAAATTAAAASQTLQTCATICDRRTTCTRHVQSVAKVEFRQLEHITIMPYTLRNEHWQIELQRVVRAKQNIWSRVLQRRKL